MKIDNSTVSKLSDIDLHLIADKLEAFLEPGAMPFMRLYLEEINQKGSYHVARFVSSFFNKLNQ